MEMIFLKVLGKEMLRIFEKAIHITTTDVQDTFVIRTISNHFDEIKAKVIDKTFDFTEYKKNITHQLKPYPVSFEKKK